MKISNAAAIVLNNALVDLIDAGAGAGYMEVRTGAGPAGGPDAAANGTLLATHAFSDPAFGASADTNPGAAAVANAIGDDVAADADGIAGYARIYDDNDVAIMDVTVSETGDGGELEFDNTDFAVGQLVTITGFTIRQPES